MRTLFFFTALFLTQLCYSQSPKGKLFIIGGGERPPAMISKLIEVSQLKGSDHIIVLPMSSAEPDTSFFYIQGQLAKATKHSIGNLNFTAATANTKTWLDSVRSAKIIFITGGDQNRFMKSVIGTPVFDAIHEAYRRGATIAGTSAGAAVMSRYMITGKGLVGDTIYHATFSKVVDKNIELEDGLGLISSAIIDQHFIVRSRYNRLFSAIAKFPFLPGIGIDEATAIIVSGTEVTVTGNSQVVVMRKPTGIQTTASGNIKFKSLEVSFYTDGDRFSLK